MRAWGVPSGCTDPAGLRPVERPDPSPGPGQVVVRMRAVSLNYRDQAVVRGQYFGGPVPRDLVPLSDGAGDVVAVGTGVTSVAVGDRVAATFFQPTPQGPAALGSPLDGVLSEYVLLADGGAVRLPDALGYAAAACLPCAGVTAWHALFAIGRPIAPGDTVLVLGTGGVSMLALQLARAAGARVVVTSSSDEKLARAFALGATDGVNYRRAPEWDREVLRVTGGRGADCIVEIGGAGTLARSYQALARGGKVALIGFLAGRQGDAAPQALMTKAGSVHGIFVGDRPMFESLLRAVSVNHIEPPVDRTFAFDEAPQAYAWQAAGDFVGKVVIAL
jgi:NADPH:quinone reductase-like Zn-dependent oxidoreductase